MEDIKVSLKLVLDEFRKKKQEIAERNGDYHHTREKISIEDLEKRILDAVEKEIGFKDSEPRQGL